MMSRTTIPIDESKLMFNSMFYCPSCTGGGDLFVADTEAYLDHRDYVYYCKKCKKTFQIKEIQFPQEND